MPNNSPVAVLEISNTEITLPENKIVWSLANSYDIDKDGNHVPREFDYQVELNGVVVSTEVMGEFTNLTQGWYTIHAKITDKRGAYSGVTMAFEVKPENAIIISCAKLQGTFDEQVAAARLLGVTHMRINSVEMKNFKGDITGVQKWADAGFKIILNVTWSDANPAPFAKGNDLAIFKANFENLVSLCGDMVYCYVFENEQTNTTFYDYANYTIYDYLAELQVGIDVCQKYSKLCCDGGLHIKIIEQIMVGNLKKDNVIRQSQCISYFKTITYSGFKINVHHNFDSNAYATDQIMNCCNYLRTQTGKQIVSNEFHYEDCSPSFMATAYNEWKKAKVLFLSVWGGNQIAGMPIQPGSEADAINKGGALTELGAAWSKLIK